MKYQLLAGGNLNSPLGNSGRNTNASAAYRPSLLPESSLSFRMKKRAWADILRLRL